MNLFKQDPKKIFEIVVAITTVIFAYYMVLYFVRTAAPLGEVQEPIVPPSVIKEPTTQKIDYDVFGAIHIDVDSPSYAKSNFDINPLTPVTLYFNEEVNVEDVTSKFSLREKESGRVVPMAASSRVRSEIDDKESYAWKWQELWQQKVIFTPQVELSPVMMYTAYLEPGFFDKNNTHTSPNGLRFEFLTADLPGVLSTNIKEEDNTFSLGEHIKIVFRSPMEKTELEQILSITPNVDLQILVNDKIMTVINDFDESGVYELTIPEETKDIYGRRFGEDYVYQFNIRN